MKSGHRQGVKKLKGGKSVLTTWLQSPTKKLSVMCVGESQAVDGARAKEVPSLDAGFLVQVGSGEGLISDTLVSGRLISDTLLSGRLISDTLVSGRLISDTLVLCLSQAQ